MQAQITTVIDSSIPKKKDLFISMNMAERTLFVLFFLSTKAVMPNTYISLISVL